MKIDIFKINYRAEHLSQYIGLKFIDVFKLVPLHSIYSPCGVCTIKELRFDASFTLTPELSVTLKPNFNGLLCDRGYKEGNLTWLDDKELKEIEEGGFLSVSEAVLVLDARIKKEQKKWDRVKNDYHPPRSIERRLNAFIEFKEMICNRDDIYYITTNKNYADWIN